jgi:hypothetical protein
MHQETAMWSIGRQLEPLGLAPGAVVPIPFSSVIASSGKLSSTDARFARRCATDDVPGIRRMLGPRRSNHASATCIGVA